MDSQLTDITEEVSAIHDLMKGEKKFFDEELGNTIKSGFLEGIQKLVEAEEKKDFYDKETTAIIKHHFGELVKKISGLKIDLSPLTEMFSEITKQNERILNLILSVPKPETNDSKYQELLSLTLEIVRKNNEFMQKSLTKETPVIKLEKKKQVEFVVTERDELTQRLTKGLFIEK